MKSDQNKKETIANAEYDRLVKLFTDAGVDKIKVEIYSELIRKVAEVFACLEVIKDLPSILYGLWGALRRSGFCTTKTIPQYNAKRRREKCESSIWRNILRQCKS